MATKKTTVKQESKLTKDKMIETAEKLVDAVEDKAEKVVDIVEDKIADTVEDAKEVAKEAIKKAKKATTKKEIKTSLFVEYYGKQVEDKVMIAAAKKAWTKSGNKVSDIKTIELYVKPEEAAVYYVINKTETGKVEF